MSQKHHPATIIDVAKRAGVSAATVSRVLNGTAVVSPETEKRIREVIAVLNYAPRPAARQLVNRRTNTIGLLLPEISGAFFSPMLKGIEAMVRAAGYDLLIYSTQSEHGDHSQHKLARHTLGEHNTDGLIIFPGSISPAEISYFHGIGFPVVLLHQASPAECGYPVVTIENKAGAKRLVLHLIEVHGCRRIVFLQGPTGHEDSVWRERGYREALADHNLPFRPELIGYGGFGEDEAFQTIHAMHQAGLDFDAVFAGDDDAATGALSALRQAGRSVPQDVAVVGFDDLPISRYLSPPLTTVRAPIEQVGRQAVELLVACIHDRPHEQEVLFPTELVIRQSCGCV